MINCAIIWVHRIFLNKTKIFTVMSFVEPIVPYSLFVIRKCMFIRYSLK